MNTPNLFRFVFAAAMLVQTACGPEPAVPPQSDSQLPDAGLAPDAGTPPDAGPLTAAKPFDHVVYCPDCAPELLAAKAEGLDRAVADLIGRIGFDADPAFLPATFRLQNGGVCGTYAPGTTGFAGLDASGKGFTCTFDLEAANRMYPFTVEWASRPEHQLLAIHEALHIWFFGRVGEYAIQEPFCKIVSFQISGAMNYGNGDACSWFTSPNGPDALMHHLCGMGFSQDQVWPALGNIARDSAAKGRVLSVQETAAAVTLAAGFDTTPAFRAAGLLP